MVEGARLESVCAGNRTEGSNPSLSKACEPCQDREGAALSSYFYVPQGCLHLRSCKEVMRAALRGCFFILLIGRNFI